MTGKPGSITCPSEGTALKRCGVVEASTGSAAHRTRRMSQGGSRVASATCIGEQNPVACDLRLPGCSVCETHDPTGEPSAGKPPAGFGERRLETEPWRGVRHRHCESRRKRLPPSAYRYRASCRLYKFVSSGGNEWQKTMARPRRAAHGCPECRRTHLSVGLHRRHLGGQVVRDAGDVPRMPSRKSR